LKANLYKIFFRLLQAEGNVNWKNSTGYTLLNYCDSPKIAAFLVTKLDVNARDKEGHTPLHRFARYDSYAPIVAILLKAGADPNIQDIDPHSVAYCHASQSLFQRRTVGGKH